ncbi:hypothetical protein Bbelb_362150 [Branchiostoma belcheri]|nr:hypothetical protein Bbelb_362150 [Branchiostoma belcheri]
MGEGGKCDIPILTLDGQTFTSSDQKAECFAEIFSEKSTIPKEENDKEVPKVSRKTHSSLKKARIRPLDHRRKVGALTLFHRMYHREAPTLLNDLVHKHKEVRRVTRQSKSHHENTLVVPVSHTNNHMRIFLPTTVKLWNSLPREIAKIWDRQSGGIG